MVKLTYSQVDGDRGDLTEFGKKTQHRLQFSSPRQ